ncbi:MAG TPA: GH25 family lysozyme [Mucilaginibacter sp.]|jgi:lysozyme
MPAAIKKSPKKKKYSPKSKIKKGVPGRWKTGILLILLALSPFYYKHILKIAAPAWRWISNMGGNPNYRSYKSFNIHIPTNYKIHGIDVSFYQGMIDWQKVKNMREDSVHIGFAFIKATEGLWLVDPYFRRNWREGQKAGITCGAYHFFWPEKSGKLQAMFFLQYVKSLKGRLPPTVDIEVLDRVPPAKMRLELNAFLKQVESQTKIKPIIYTPLKFYRDYLRGYFDNYNFWIAHYSEPELNLGDTALWEFWQHSDKAKVNGIPYVVDFDVFNGDSLAFKKLLVH